MNETLTVESDGIRFKGDLLATREEFFFTLWEATEISTGRTFETLDEVNAEFDLSMNEETLARLAATEAGIDYERLCDMSHSFSRRAYWDSIR